MNHLAYVDTSAFIKLLLTEDETPALRTALTEWPDLVSSEILFIEAHRVGVRENRQADVATLLQGITLLGYTPAVRQRAPPSEPRSCGPSTPSTSPPPKRSATTSASSSPTISACSATARSRAFPSARPPRPEAHARLAPPPSHLSTTRFLSHRWRRYRRLVSAAPLHEEVQQTCDEHVLQARPEVGRGRSPTPTGAAPDPVAVLLQPPHRRLAIRRS